MDKFRLVADPQFKAPVEIPVLSGGTKPISFTFKHRTLDEMESFGKNEAVNLSGVELIKSMAVGWDLSESFDDDNLRLLCQNYIPAPGLILDVYYDALLAGRRKN